MGIRQFRHRVRQVWRVYATSSNVVVLVALVVAISLVWSTVSNIQRNFDAQRRLADLQRQEQLTELEVETLKLQQNYYKTDEYKELVARRDLGLAAKGEDVLILPTNSQAVIDEDARDSSHGETSVVPAEQVAPEKSNFNQWLEFLSGKAARSNDEST